MTAQNAEVLSKWELVFEFMNFPLKRGFQGTNYRHESKDACTLLLEKKC